MYTLEFNHAQFGNATRQVTCGLLPGNQLVIECIHEVKRTPSFSNFT